MLSTRARSTAATFVTLGLTYGVWYGYSVFLVALLGEFGWSRTVLAGAFSLFTLVHGFASAPLGWLADRIGPRRLVLTGGLLLAVGLLLVAGVERPWHLYLAFGMVAALGVAAAGWVPAVVLVQRWFPERVGTALGLTSAGIGVGIFVVVPACGWLIDLVGWRWAYRALALAALAWTVPAALWLVADPPRLTRTAEGPTPTRGDVSLGEAGRMTAFWLLSVVVMCAAFVNQMLLAHQVAYLVDHGIAALVAASVVGVVGIASIAGKTGGGWASDRLGREVTYTFGMACVVASIGLLGVLALRPGPGWAYAYGVLIGIGYSITAALMPAVVSDFFRGRHFGAIYGALNAASAVGGSLGPWLGGRVFDTTGSYRLAFVAAIAAASLATGALWIAGPRRRRE